MSVDKSKPGRKKNPDSKRTEYADELIEQYMNSNSTDVSNNVEPVTQLAKDKNSLIQPLTESKYYIPSLSDFRLGTVYEQKWPVGGGWRVSILEDEQFDMSYGHCEFMTIASNMRWGKSVYRIKFLDDDDVESLGFDKVKPGVFEFKACTIILNWAERCNLKVYVDDDVVFKGRVLNISELKTVLTMLTILKDEERERKFNGVR